jgi:hypothetical protein
MAFLLALAAMGLTVGFFFEVPGKRLLVWLTLLLALGGLIWGAIGIKRAFSRPRVYGGRITAPIFGVIALLVCGLLGFLFFHTRSLPASTGAPQIGQKAPEFTLTDTHGNQVSLGQMLGGGASPGAANVSAGSAGTPKAVLLVFYRGYW